MVVMEIDPGYLYSGKEGGVAFSTARNHLLKSDTGYNCFRDTGNEGVDRWMADKGIVELVPRDKGRFSIIPTDANTSKIDCSNQVVYGTLRNSVFGDLGPYSRGNGVSLDHNARQMIKSYIQTKEGQEYLAELSKDGSARIDYIVRGDLGGTIMAYGIDEAGKKFFMVDEKYMEGLKELFSEFGGIDEESMLEFAIMEELAHIYGAEKYKMPILKEERRAKTKVYEFFKKKSESSDISIAHKYGKLLDFAEAELKSFAARYKAADSDDLESHANGLFASYLSYAEDELGLEGHDAVEYALKETEKEIEDKASEESGLEEGLEDEEDDSEGQEQDSAESVDDVAEAA